MPDSLRLPTLAASPCPSDETLVAFALGHLSGLHLASVHDHLDSCETCQHLLSEAAHGLGEAATVPHSQHAAEELGWATTFQSGAVVGKRYRIAHFIARGGMGEVYEAFDDELQQRVALKTVTSTASDNAAAVRRLKAEVQLARRVSHPNVCRIYDFGTHVVAQTGAQVSFLTMEFVDGETLGQHVRLGGALPLPEALSIARQLLLGLSAAHAAGVLHRDFKSDNVMLRADALDRVTPLILDFGLARTLDHRAEGPASSSNSSLVGTLDYIAPEQLEGKPHTIASDVYSFGVVWFEMLTGELPFDAGSATPSNALQRLQRPAPAPSRKNPSLPSGLDAIVLRCLRRAAKDRFQSAEAVLSALDAFDQRASSLWRRRTWLALGLGLSALGFVGYLSLRARPEHASLPRLTRTLNAASAASAAVNAELPSTPDDERAPSSSAPALPALPLAAALTRPKPPAQGRVHTAAQRHSAQAAATDNEANDRAGSLVDAAAAPLAKTPTGVESASGERRTAATQGGGSGWENPFGKSSTGQGSAGRTALP